MKNMGVIRNWSCSKFGLGIQDKFEKDGKMYVQGNIYGNIEHEDGEYILVGPIVKLSDDSVLVEGNEMYELQDMSDGYEL